MAHSRHKARHTSNGRGHAGQEDATEAASTVMSTIEDGYDQVRKQAKRFNRQGREMFDQWSGELGQCVQDRPVQSLFAAAGVGLVVGFLLGKRH